MNPIDQIKNTLEKTFTIVHLHITDDSWKHAGHEGAKSGGGHYLLQIVSPDFSDKTLLLRHRMVKDCLKEEFKTIIHALSIKAFTPEEFKKTPDTRLQT
jgi:BolA family transcriptional regulator, general stress-responsive regulator